MNTARANCTSINSIISQVGIHFSIRQSGFSIRGIVTSPPTPPPPLRSHEPCKAIHEMSSFACKKRWVPRYRNEWKSTSLSSEDHMDCSISIFGGFYAAPESLRNEMVLHLKIKNEFSNYRMQKEWKISQMLISISTTCSLKESWMSGMVWIYLLSKILPPLRPTPGALLRPSGASMRFSRTEQLQILKMWRQGGKAVQYTL